jgi:hypothetical protein
MDKESMTSFNWASINVLENRPVEVDPKCNALTFINIGATLAIVNGVPLNPTLVPGANGESFSIPGNYGEFFNGRIDVSFQTGAGNLLVIQKYYTE